MTPAVSRHHPSARPEGSLDDDEVRTTPPGKMNVLPTALLRQ